MVESSFSSGQLLYSLQHLVSLPAILPFLQATSTRETYSPSAMAPRGSGKRAREVIDLTGDDEEPNTTAKAPRVTADTFRRYPLSASSANVGSSQSSLPGRPSQSFSRASQPTSSYTTASSSDRRLLASQDEEPDLIDLTQSEDGPPLELYGNLGTWIVLFHPKATD